ncbi:MAG: carboxylating nicotinate-nucleotide diphosphorylase [Firmicutes bacterium]|nr:carboxylating nicotinate-nucleotide diphosphorylase [Bacillota bacterium]
MNSTIQLIKNALKEDMPHGDISTDSLFKDEISEARLIAKESGVLSGMNICQLTFLEVDPSLEFTVLFKDSCHVSKGEVIALVKGRTKSILKAERVALNFLQRMSGIATLTAKFVEKTKGTNAMILDTRKTTPTLRILEKQAVLDGGGKNHRMNLSEMVMLKDNHIQAAASITRAVEIVKSKIPSSMKIEVEVETIEGFIEALYTPCDIIMLDNMSLENMKKCVSLNQNKKKLEASGNMTLDRIEEVSKTGVDYISVGQLTHSYQSLDISLKF